MSLAEVKEIRENIARAKAALSRGNFVKSFEAAIVAVEIKMRTLLIGKDKFEIEFLLEEYCSDLSNNQMVRDFLAVRQVYVQPFLPYRKGREKNTIKRLRLLTAEWAHKDQQEAQAQEEQHERKKIELLRRSQKLLDNKEYPRAKSILRRVAERYGAEPGVIADVGRRMVECKLYPEAADILCEAVDRFPSDPKAYGLLVRAHLGNGNLDKAEKVYLDALKQFGAHPRTQLNLSRLYLQMRKLDEAYDYARLAIQGDPALTEAQEIIDKVEPRIFSRRSTQYKF